MNTMRVNDAASLPISSMMQRRILSVDVDDTVQRVEAFMAGEGLSWVPVLASPGSLLGVISAGDLLRFHAAGKEAAAVCAWQLCTYKPIAVSPDTPVEAVAALMVENKLHHVVVMQGERFEGVVSSLDFVKAFVPDTPAPRQPTPA